MDRPHSRIGRRQSPEGVRPCPRRYRRTSQRQREPVSAREVCRGAAEVLRLWRASYQRRTRRKTGRCTEFKADTYRATRKPKLMDFWDFGPNPPKHCSYAYQMVYGSVQTDGLLQPPAFAIACRPQSLDGLAVRQSQRFRRVPARHRSPSTARPTGLGGNTFRHDGKGQNVMFLDTHVDFEKRSFCGLDGDNIYTVLGRPDRSRSRGYAAEARQCQPSDQRDCCSSTILSCRPGDSLFPVAHRPAVRYDIG